MLINKRTSFLSFAAFAVAVFIVSSMGYAVDISLVPNYAEREVGGKVRMLVYANSAVDLISMGVKVEFDPSVLQVAGASKWQDFNTGWVMDADGDDATTSDQYFLPPVENDQENGSVMMFGGRLIGTSTTGLTGQVILGWIDFDCIGSGNSSLVVDLAKENPNPGATFVNFARLDGTADEPTNTGTIVGQVCVRTDACEGNIDGDIVVGPGDVGLLRLDFARNDCLADGKACAADIDSDGVVGPGDVGLLRTDFARNDCGCPQ